MSLKKHLETKAKKKNRDVPATVPEPRRRQISKEEFLAGIKEVKPATPIPGYKCVLF